jgi:Co/Zn/Cd efflux system component
MRPHAHGHSHGTIDSVVLSTQHGIEAVKWSAVALLLTALIQFAIMLISGSVALLADTIHNLGDALSGLPLWLAFVLARRQSTLRFTMAMVGRKTSPEFSLSSSF